MQRRQLPSLGALAIFEVAAKHLSFTVAARELNVTQGAVSQQVRLLEDTLNTKLFLRKHNALELTSDGVDLFAAVTAGLDRISAGVGLLRPRAAMRPRCLRENARRLAGRKPQRAAARDRRRGMAGLGALHARCN